jgi:hypothetical protein
MYRSLYKLHEYALRGPTKVTMDTLVYLPVQLPTTFEFIINLKRRMPSN